MPKTMQEDAMLAPLDLKSVPGLKEKIVATAKKERLSVAEWSRRALAKSAGYRMKKGE